MSKNRSTITNYLRLLKLPAEVQLAIRDNTISMGHARAILAVEEAKDQLKVLQKAVKEELSVRQVEELVRKLNSSPENEEKQAEGLPGFFKDSADTLRQNLDTGIRIRRNNKGKGQIVISFESDQDFSRIMGLIGKADSE